MKGLFFFLSILTILSFISCTRNESSSAQNQPKKNVSVSVQNEGETNEIQTISSLEELLSNQNSSKMPKWVAPEYIGLQLGKDTQEDVIKMFGKPKEEFHPFSEYESTKDEWVFYYENINDFDGRISFIFDIRSKILKVIWLRPNDDRPLTIEKAISIYGKDYFVRGIGKNICSSKKTTKLEYPFTIVYPQKGIFFWIREGNQVDDIFYAAKCT